MSPSLIRRALIVLVLILWAAALWLFLNTGTQAASSGSKLTYKVRAYATTKKAASSVLNLGKSRGYKGNIRKAERPVEKFMGYIVAQDLADDVKGDKLAYIQDFLESRGYRSVLEEDSINHKKMLRLEQFFPDEKSAQQVADNLKKLTTASFEVKRHTKNVSYKSFEVVFTNIREKEKAVKLQQEVKQFTPDAEVISY
ncbi:MAG: hypothetical protein LWY06_12750 [Firmicutes bacterium]|nr:hypothetical protein [Bacillota bacterium]